MIENRIKYISREVNVIDLQFSYTPEHIYEMISAYGEQGRQLYLSMKLPADLIYPVVYAFLFSLIKYRVYHIHRCLFEG